MATHAYTTPSLLPATDSERRALLGTQQARRSLLDADRDNTPGPVTLAIRGVRPNERSSSEMRQRQMVEEAKALRDLRRRVANAVEVAIAFLDAAGGDPDFEDGADDEPSLGSLGGTGTARMLTGFGFKGERWAGGSDDDREEDAGDMPETVNEDGDFFGLGY
ncbi:hypothetical protein MBUL_01464 [Methylobacterium bullatum]|uniref:Uncharacterized protein n=1 Tax=Methylobacterium bullatum TaxID=570505 RepID=A0A679IPT6_9HYPH|nr:hypothetical protein MBUL_01464 [Methylobacterium bullatum]